jgi:D-cysteine desulfhydrase family pyridoxal phosphate-dependent enzyme
MRHVNELTAGVGDASALEAFSRIRRLRLASFYTPIERADRLRAQLPGAPHIFVKRDDCTGYLGGGNKLRKLEYVMADVLATGATTVITVGSVKSNHARTTAMVARRLGLKCVLVLSGDAPREPTAGSRLNELLGVTAHLVGTREERSARVAEVAAELEASGERVYKIPLGCSDEIGSFGLVAAMEEVRVQKEMLGVDFDAVVLSSTSGGTQAGLEVGRRLFGLTDWQILGVSPAGPSAWVKDYVQGALNPMLARLGLEGFARPEDLSVDDNFVGNGYGVPTAESEEAARMFADSEGIILDPVYTSKAAAALVSYCRERKFSRTDRVLFWHTGGLMALF